MAAVRLKPSADEASRDHERRTQNSETSGDARAGRAPRAFHLHPECNPTGCFAAVRAEPLPSTIPTTSPNRTFVLDPDCTAVTYKRQGVPIFERYGDQTEVSVEAEVFSSDPEANDR